MVFGLLSSIREFHIEGDTETLAEELTKSCRIMIELTDQVSEFRRILITFSDTNNSPQYQKACDASASFLRNLYTQLNELTDLQNRAISFIDRINEFNDMPPCGARPVVFDEQIIDIHTNNQRVTMVREEIEAVIRAIGNMVNVTICCCQSLNASVDSLGMIWRDEQYDYFSDFVQGIVNTSQRSVQDLEDYYNHLVRKLNSL